MNLITLLTSGALGLATAHATPRLPVAVAIVDTVPLGGTDAVILRRAAGSPRDVILLRRNASVDALAGAFATYLAVIKVEPVISVQSKKIIVYQKKGPASWVNRERKMLAQVHSKLHQEPLTLLEGVGKAAWRTLYVNPDRVKVHGVKQTIQQNN
jgi:hypothetical protein